jgi:hypothetical protein
VISPLAPLEDPQGRGLARLAHVDAQVFELRAIDDHGLARARV